MRTGVSGPTSPSLPLRAVHLAGAAALAYGCGTLLPTEDAPRGAAPDAAGTADSAPRPVDDAAPPDAAAEAGASCPDGSEPQQLTLVASAATTFSAECDGNTTYGSEPVMDVGLDQGRGVGLVRFDLADPEADLLAGGTIVGGRLDLSASPNCPACGSGLPTQAGTIAVHPLRPDWREGASGGAGNGADRCRRETDKGWGPDRAPGTGTDIAGGGVDYDEAADTTAVPDDAEAVTIFLDDRTITARNAVPSKRISFLLRMPSGGRMLVATREKSSDEAPRLAIRYCK